MNRAGTGSSLDWYVLMQKSGLYGSMESMRLSNVLGISVGWKKSKSHFSQTMTLLRNASSKLGHKGKRLNSSASLALISVGVELLSFAGGMFSFGRELFPVGEELLLMSSSSEFESGESFFRLETAIFCHSFTSVVPRSMVAGSSGVLMRNWLVEQNGINCVLDGWYWNWFDLLTYGCEEGTRVRLLRFADTL